MLSIPQTPTPILKNKYENNNDVNKKHQAKQHELTMTADCKTYSTVTSSIKSSDSVKSLKQSSKKKSGCIHLNNLWSIWYGLFGTGLQAYAAFKCLKRTLGYSLLGWPEGLPFLELNCSLGLTGAAFLLLPVFLAVAILKIGNLANDGFKLGRQISTCSKDTETEDTAKSGCGLFRYGGPTAPFIHIAISFCLLVPKLLMEARLIESGFLSQDWIWHTDLDFMIRHRDRLVVLSFMPSNATHKMDLINPRTSALQFNSESQVTTTVMKTLKDYIGHDNHTTIYDKSIDSGWVNSVSVEYLNLAIALVIYSVRYPALFWSTNKCLGIIFSFQLLINGLHTLISFAGMSILYKVHIAGVWKSLPLLKHNARSVYTFGSPTPFLLNSQVTFGMYMLSTLLVLSSSIVLYFYGHTRFHAFLDQERERKIISLKGEGGNRWGYFTHCAALCVLISIGICNAPLLHDYTVVYRGSLDDITLICIIAGILHLFFWIVIWLFLTIKHKWTFKLRITIARATVRESRSLKLVTDVHLASQQCEDLSQQPLLVVGNGRTYSVIDNSPKRAIMSVIQKTTIAKKSQSNGSITANSNTDDDGEEQIYWLRPALAPQMCSPDGHKYFCWTKKKQKHKVTFNDDTASANRKGASIKRRSVIGAIEELDDGDYATLRELPLVPPQSSSYQKRMSNSEDTASEEGKTTGPAPKCLRRTDSGIPHEEPIRSDSVSTESSNSPPDLPGSNHSETSSGIHSNESAEHKTAEKLAGEWKSPQQEDLPASHMSPLVDHSMTESLLDAPESTVVIRRKSTRINPNEGVSSVILNEDPYGRATNMRMTSFTDVSNDLQNMQSSSATLPHYPTQPVQNVYPHCSTMPLPHNNVQNSNSKLGNGNSCNVMYPRQHSTIPTHHNGVNLISNPMNNTNVSQNPYIKRLHPKTGFVINEPIYTKINRATGELYHYSS
ncbi:unnamed protein product [Brassicogethes aeneus]|uniref:Protein tincar n=1 Tax=Brassicogethes aeneus TaxID=1431903 RepID=A0A9P0B5W9_BRAAE|nr:unnamed protein product [Brassicogethes aeneus]